MTAISKDELLVQLRSRSVEDVVRLHVFGGDPVVFRGRPQLYDRLRGRIADGLGLATRDVVMVGSAKIGYSLDPNNFGRAFHAESDVDMVVVSESLFDQVWRSLLEWRYPWHTRTWSKPERLWATERMEDLLHGWCAPSRIVLQTLAGRRQFKPLQAISARWFDRFRGLSWSSPGFVDGWRLGNQAAAA